MDLKELRERLVCNQDEKQKTFETNFIEETKLKFKNYLINVQSIRIEEMALRIEIITLLNTSTNKNIRNEIQKNISLFFNVCQKMIDTKMAENVSSTVESFKDFLKRPNDPELEIYEESEASEEEFYGKFDWINEKKIREKIEARISQARSAQIAAELRASAEQSIPNDIGEINDNILEDFTLIDDINLNPNSDATAEEINTEDHINTHEVINTNSLQASVPERILRFLRRNREATLLNRDSIINNDEPYELERSQNMSQDEEEEDHIVGPSELIDLLNSRFSPANTPLEFDENNIRSVDNFVVNHNQVRENINHEFLSRSQMMGIGSDSNNDRLNALLAVVRTGNIISAAQNQMNLNRPIDEKVLVDGTVNFEQASRHAILSDRSEISSITSSEIQASPIVVNHNSIMNITFNDEPHLVKFIIKFICLINANSVKIETLYLFILWIFTKEPLSFLSKDNQIVIMEKITLLLKDLNKSKYFRKILSRLCYHKIICLAPETVKFYEVIINKSNASEISLSLDEITSLENIKFSDKIAFLSCYIKWERLLKNTKESYHEVTAILDDMLLNNHNSCLLLIGKLCINNPTAQKLCFTTNLSQKILRVYFDLIRKQADLNNILFCIYALMGEDEGNRKVFCLRKVAMPLIDTLKLRIKDKNFDKTALLIICFLKASARCTRFTRSDIHDLPIIELLLLTLRYVKKSKKSMDYEIIEIIEKKAVKENDLCSFNILKQTLSAIANLMVDYGPYRYKFVANNGLRTVGRYIRKRNLNYYALFILKNFLYECSWALKELWMIQFHNRIPSDYPNILHFGPTEGDFEESKNEIYPRRYSDYVSTHFQNKNKKKEMVNIFYIKNAKLPLFDNVSFYPEKRELNITKIVQLIQEAIDNGEYYVKSDIMNIFNRFIRKYNPIRKKPKNICKVLREVFNILRNMTCGTTDETITFLLSYPYLIENSVIIFIRLAEQELTKASKKLIIEIIYLFSNLCSNFANIREIFSLDFFLEHLKTMTLIKERKMIIAIIWLITNLSRTDKEVNSFRMKNIIRFGFKSWLRRVGDTDAYVYDRVKNALDNMESQ